MSISKTIKTLGFLLALAVARSACAGFFPGGGLRDHGHTAPGDGGSLANPSITGGNIHPDRVDADTVTWNNGTAGRVGLIGTSGALDDDGGLLFNQTTEVLTVGSVSASVQTNVKGQKIATQTTTEDIGCPGGECLTLITFPEVTDTRNEWNGSTYTAVAAQTLTFVTTGTITADLESLDNYIFKFCILKNGVYVATFTYTELNQSFAFSISTTVAVGLGDTIALWGQSLNPPSTTYTISIGAYLSIVGELEPGSSTGGLTVNGPITTPMTASRVLMTNASNVISTSPVTSTTLGYLDATSSIQTQLDLKSPLASPAFTGNGSITGLWTPKGGMTTTGTVTTAGLNWTGATHIFASVQAADTGRANNSLQLISWTEGRDTLTEFNGSTFTATNTGDYSICVRSEGYDGSNFTAGYVKIVKNGLPTTADNFYQFAAAFSLPTNTITVAGCVDMYLAANDKIDIRILGTTTDASTWTLVGASGDPRSILSIHRLP
jgi:hypothetical protein